jgi:hypothetical protein
MKEDPVVVSGPRVTLLEILVCRYLREKGIKQFRLAGIWWG